MSNRKHRNGQRRTFRQLWWALCLKHAETYGTGA